MSAFFVRLLKDRAGFTAIEYGLMAALGLIVAGQMVSNKL